MAGKQTVSLLILVTVLLGVILYLANELESAKVQRNEPRSSTPSTSTSSSSSSRVVDQREEPAAAHIVPLSTSTASQSKHNNNNNNNNNKNIFSSMTAVTSSSYPMPSPTETDFVGMIFDVTPSSYSGDEKSEIELVRAPANTNNAGATTTTTTTSTAVVATVNYNQQFDCIRNVQKKFFTGSYPDRELLIFPQTTTKRGDDPDLKHGDLVVFNWAKLEDMYKTDYSVVRTVTYCLKGAGHGGDTPLVASDTWKNRGGGHAINPIFAVLHGGVSPGRLVQMAVRSAQYLNTQAAYFRHENRNKRRMSPAALEEWHRLLQTKSIAEFRSSSSSSSSSSSATERHQQTPKVVVDVGGGHGAMLSVMCPPHPRLWCYGVDFSEGLIKQAKSFFPHIHFHHGISAPHIPTGTADAVLSSAVLPMIRFSHVCASLYEVIRMLRPGGGNALFWQMATMRFGRFHPSFFADDEEFYLSNIARDNLFMPAWKKVAVEVGNFETNDFRTFNNSNTNTNNARNDDSSRAHKPRTLPAHKILSRCPGRLGQYISRLEIVGGDPRITVYTPAWLQKKQGPIVKSFFLGMFGVRLFRNDVPFKMPDKTRKNDQKDGDSDESTTGFATSPLPDASKIATRLAAPAGLIKCVKNRRNWDWCTDVAQRDFDASHNCSNRKKIAHPGGKPEYVWCMKEQSDAMTFRNTYKPSEF